MSQRTARIPEVTEEPGSPPHLAADAATSMRSRRWAAEQLADDYITNAMRLRGRELAESGCPDVRDALLSDLTKPGGWYALLDEALNEVLGEHPVAATVEAGR
jgi:hypothetical protein